MKLFTLYPAYLWAFLAISIPIAIHLLFKKKTREIIFPPVELLAISAKKKRFHFRIHEWLLLLIRIIIMICLTFLFARPVLQAFSVVGETSSRAGVIVVDNTPSMYWMDAGGFKPFDDLKKRAGYLLDSIPGQTPVALMPVSDKSDISNIVFWTDKEKISKKISNIKPDNTSTSYSTALRRAYKLLRTKTASRKWIVLLSDFQKSGWKFKTGVMFPEIDKNVLLVLVDAGGIHKKTYDVSLAGININPDYVYPGTPFPAGVEVSFMPDDLSNDINGKVLINSREIRRFSLSDKDSVNRGMINKDLFLTIQDNRPLPVRIQLIGDARHENNSRYFVYKPRKGIRVLVIDGDKKNSLISSESFYVKEALSPGPGLDYRIRTPFLPDILPVMGNIEKFPDKKYDLIFLLNVRTLSTGFIRDMLHYINKGGGAALFLGDRVDIPSYNQGFQSFFPYVLTKPVSNKTSFDLKNIKPEQTPLFLEPLLKDKTILSKVEFNKYIQLKQGNTLSDPGTKILLNFNTGDPALITKQIGAGKLMVFTSSADMDWNNFPTRSSFLPFIQQISYGLLKKNQLPEKPVECGETIRKYITKNEDPAGIRLPDGSKYRLNTQRTGRQMFVEWSRTSQPGIYAITNREKDIDYFAVNVAYEERILDFYNKNEFLTYWGEKKPAWVKPEDNASDILKKIFSGKDLTRYFLILLFILGIGEFILAGRFY